MERQGLSSEFPMEDISVMGALELLPHIFKLKTRLQIALMAAVNFQPHIVVAIDSKGFSYRVLKELKAKCFEQQRKAPVSVLYVAPSAWAWKGGEKRLKKWVGIVDHILCILPFEVRQCKENGLAATFVGHPVLEDAYFDSARVDAWTSNWHITGNKDAFFSEHGIGGTTTLVSLLPGSRLQEVKRMMPIYGETLQILADSQDLTVVIPTTFSSQLIRAVESAIGKWNVSVMLIPGATLKQKYEAFNASTVGLCTSGTAVLQMQLARLPCVVAYRANLVTEWLVKHSIQLKYMSLPNILMDSPIIPEAAFSECTPGRLAELLRKVMEDKAVRHRQVSAAEQMFRMLSPRSTIEAGETPCQGAAGAYGLRDEVVRPSIVAAKRILGLLERSE